MKLLDKFDTIINELEISDLEKDVKLNILEDFRISTHKKFDNIIMDKIMAENLSTILTKISNAVGRITNDQVKK